MVPLGLFDGSDIHANMINCTQSRIGLCTSSRATECKAFMLDSLHVCMSVVSYEGYNLSVEPQQDGLVVVVL